MLGLWYNQIMSHFLTKKGQGEIQKLLTGLLKCSALPFGIMALCALILGLLANSFGLSGSELAWNFVIEASPSMTTISLQVLISIYFGMVLLAPIPIDHSTLKNFWEIDPYAKIDIPICLLAQKEWVADISATALKTFSHWVAYSRATSKASFVAGLPPLLL